MPAQASKSRGNSSSTTDYDSPLTEHVHTVFAFTYVLEKIAFLHPSRKRRGFESRRRHRDISSRLITGILSTSAELDGRKRVCVFLVDTLKPASMIDPRGDTETVSSPSLCRNFQSGVGLEPPSGFCGAEEDEEKSLLPVEPTHE